MPCRPRARTQTLDGCDLETPNQSLNPLIHSCRGRANLLRPSGFAIEQQKERDDGRGLTNKSAPRQRKGRGWRDPARPDPVERRSRGLSPQRRNKAFLTAPISIERPAVSSESLRRGLLYRTTDGFNTGPALSRLEQPLSILRIRQGRSRE